MAEENQSGQHFMCLDGKPVPTDKAGLFIVFPPKSTEFFNRWTAMNGRVILAQELLSRKGNLDNETRKNIEDAYIERKACQNKLMATLVAPEINLGRGAPWLVCVPVGVVGIEIWSDEDFDAEKKFLDEQKLAYIGERFDENGDHVIYSEDPVYSDVSKAKVQSKEIITYMEGYKREMYRLYQPNVKK